ncbi:MAG: rubredoxin [Bacillota bacterium]
MEEYTCIMCGYLYNPKEGTDEIDAGTDFVELDDDWSCPMCGAGKFNFEEADEEDKEEK